MIFGGLEFVAGGYLIHRHYKNKNEQKRLEDEAQAQRHYTFPGTKPLSCLPTPIYPHPYQQSVYPQQKYAYHATVAPIQSHQHQLHHPPHHQQQLHVVSQSRPKPCQQFAIPRRPVPERKPELIIHPSLQRSDSLATLSRMPVANGLRPQPTNLTPTTTGCYSVDAPPPPRRHATGPLLHPDPPHQPGLYSNPGFSVSTPAFGATPTSPPVSYRMASPAEASNVFWGRDNDVREHRISGYAATESTALGEQEPPPPYVP